MPRIKALPRTLFDFVAGAVTFVLLAFAALVLWLRYAAFPYIDSYREPIVSSIEKASGMRISVREISAGWGGLRPVVQLRGMRIEDRRGKAAFQLDRVEVQLAWWALFLGQVRFADVDFYRPELSLRRGADGLIYLADKALNTAAAGDDGAFTEWLLSQPSVGIHDASLTWRDEKVGAPEVRLTNVQIELRKELGHHRAALTAVPPRELAAAIDIRADVKLSREGGVWRARGQAFAEARNADLGRLRAHLPVPETLRNGVGSVRVWTQFTRDGVDELVADLAMRDARAQLAADALPLELASISGRARYRAQPTGFTFTTEGLRFRLPSGLEAQPGNFALARKAQPGRDPQSEVRADGIDLKIAATLLDYFPVPPDVKGQALRFAPRGQLTDAVVTWSGDEARPARSYALHGRFRDLAVNAVDAIPGVSGLSGEIEGTEAGGTLRVTGTNARFEQLHVFRAPLAIDRLEARAHWKHEGGATRVTIEQASFANEDAEGSVTGSWRSLPESKTHSPGYIDLKGHLTRAKATSVARYMPNTAAPVRDWLERAIRSGDSSRATFELKGDLYEFPFGRGSNGHFLVEGDIHDGSLRYLPDWPGVEAVEGTLRFENRRMEIRAKSARIFSSHATAVAAVVEDLGAKPPLLTIDGDVDTTGADGLRFLRESPLVNGPGSFTKSVNVEGPGRLKLHLDIPLGGADPVRVAGDYQFNGDVATTAGTLVLRDLRGRLSFTERGVRAPDLAGTLFGQPAQIAISSQPDGQVATTVQGRIDAANLAAYVPEAIAARATGATEW
ncbi:MAG: YhdP family protein, partial [Betaproteobacteria bacterium]